MSNLLLGIDDKLAKWIAKQKVFFVSTAPLSANGHINCSPKGLDTIRVIDSTTVVYCDLNGSGVETIAHIQENKRILIMLCAFQGSPKIVRLHGVGTVLLPEDKDFASLHQLFGNRTGVRSIIKISLTRVSSSCGYGVPKMEYVVDRKVLDDWMDSKGESGLNAYKKRNNALSIDGLPGLVS